MMNTDTWLVVPLFNEGAIVGEVIRHARTRFPKIVCIDDGSTDRSAELAAEAGAAIVTHPFNLGQGASLQTGLAYALGDPEASYFVTFDADGQHSVDDAERMVNRLRAEPLDVVLGSRFLDSASKPGWAKRVVLKTAVMFERMSTRLKVTDTHNGLRAFNRTAAESIQIRQNRMAHASEILREIARAELRYAEESVRIEYTEYSRSKGQSLWNSVNIINELIFDR